MKLFNTLIFYFSTLTIFINFPQNSIAKDEKQVTVYSHRHYQIDKLIYDQFYEKTGIKVNLVKASADVLLERIKSEGENSRADILITVDASRLWRAVNADLLQKINSPILNEKVPANLRDPGGRWYGLTVRARVIMFAKDRVKAEELSTYEDLANEKWKGRILARSSSNAYNQSLMSSIIKSNGTEKALEWAIGIKNNMSRNPRGNDRDQLRAVANGLGDIAIANTYYLGLLLHSEDKNDIIAAKKLGIFFPNQEGRGAHINISGAGIVKSSHNVENSIKLLEFLVSDAIQKEYAKANFEYPLLKKNNISETLSSWGEYKSESTNISKLGELNIEAVEVFNKAGWR